MGKEIIITELNEFGQGKVTFDNKVYFTSLMLNEKALVSLDKNTIKVDKRLTDNIDRIKPICPIYDACGGCQLMHYNYEAQLKLKENIFKNAMIQAGLNVKVLDVIGSKHPLHYRNKIQMTFGFHKDKVVAGLYEENTHRIVNVHACDIQDDKANLIIQTIKQLMKKHKIMPFNEHTFEGIIRHVLIKHSERTNEILVVIITPSKVFPGKQNIIKDLKQLHPEITSIVHGVNGKDTSMVLGDEFYTITGKGYIEDVLLGNRFIIGPKTFYQVNSYQTEVLYQKVIDVLNPKETDIVLDAYSGIGTIGLSLAKMVKEVYAVEINKESVKNGIKNAQLNQIKNITFIQDDAKNYMLDLAANNALLDAIILDPPRMGLDPKLIDAILTLKPKKVVYVSCDPHTLARDLKLLSKGYHFNEVQPVDMFSQTYHIENVVLLKSK